MPAFEVGSSTLQNAAAALGNGTALDLEGYDQITLQVTGTFVATLTWEATIDGTTWVAVAAADLSSATRARATTATAAGLFLLDGIRGLQQVRARISAYTSGNVTVVGVPSS